MKYFSICSGIEAASVAWHPLGWQAVGFAENDKFASAVLAHHYPDVRNYGDITKFKDWPDAAFDVLVGGTPCQSFSVAGLRKGLADPRGNLALVYLAIAERYQPHWLIWENVPGVLSSSGGRDFGSFLGGLGQLGYGFAYRVLDAQHVRVDGLGRAVPQRRRRVFVVGHLGDWRRAAAVLFERESLFGHSAPRREAGQGTAFDVAPCIGASGRGFERTGDPRGQDCLVAFGGNNTRGEIDVGTAVNAHGGPTGRLDFESETFVVNRPSGLPKMRHGSDELHQDGTEQRLCLPILQLDRVQPSTLAEQGALIAFSCKDHEADAGPDTAPTLRAMGHDGSHANAGPSGGGQPTCVAFDMRGREGGSQFEGPHDTANIRAASGGSSRSYVAGNWAVRRLTPKECCRLQGFPDDYLSQITWRGKSPPPDGPMYKALGNSMAVNCMRWLGTRIQTVEDETK